MFSEFVEFLYINRNNKKENLNPYLTKTSKNVSLEIGMGSLNMKKTENKEATEMESSVNECGQIVSIKIPGVLADLH